MNFIAINIDLAVLDQHYARLRGGWRQDTFIWAAKESGTCPKRVRLSFNAWSRRFNATVTVDENNLVEFDFPQLVPVLRSALSSKEKAELVRQALNADDEIPF